MDPSLTAANDMCVFYLVDNIIILGIWCKTSSCIFHSLPEIKQILGFLKSFWWSNCVEKVVPEDNIVLRYPDKSELDNSDCKTYLRGMSAMLPTVLPPGASISEWKGPDMVSVVDPEVESQVSKVESVADVSRLEE